MVPGTCRSRELVRSRWRWRDLEDRGEMMAIDAKHQLGQKLSRLLNLTYGILGQGQKLIVLVTANEDFGKLNPAITRAERCSSEIEFRAFPTEEANIWLRDAGCESRVNESRPLSEMYAMTNSRGKDSIETPIGFLHLAITNCRKEGDQTNVR